MAKNKKQVILIAVLAVMLVAAMACVWFVSAPKGAEGEKALTVTVVYADGTDDVFRFSTDAEFLRGALEEQNLIEGDEAEYGLFVKTVNGVTVDDAQQQWWCFTKGGEELMTGVDTTPVADGDSFEITLITGW